jgi:nucleotide-binding universal stress UspA family protein
MFERIMVPTDGSPASEAAIPIALRLAGTLGADVLLVQVVPYPTDYNPFVAHPDAYELILSAAEQHAATNLGRLEALFVDGGVRTRILSPLGSPAAALLDAEREEHADLVVMGTHGRTGPSRFALGSVADRLVREGMQPVLLVRAAGFSGLSSALVMLDGSEVAEEVLPVVEALARRPIAFVRLFQAVDDPTERPAARAYLEGVSGRLAAVDLRTQVEVEVGKPATLAGPAAQDSDLIILCTHGRGGFDRFRHGSVAERVVREAVKPVLLVRAGTLAIHKPSQEMAARPPQAQSM